MTEPGEVEIPEFAVLELKPGDLLVLRPRLAMEPEAVAAFMAHLAPVTKRTGIKVIVVEHDVGVSVLRAQAEEGAA